MPLPLTWTTNPEALMFFFLLADTMLTRRREHNQIITVIMCLDQPILTYTSLTWVSLVWRRVWYTRESYMFFKLSIYSLFQVGCPRKPNAKISCE